MKKFSYFCNAKKNMLFITKPIEGMTKEEKKKEIKARRNAIRMASFLKQFRYVKNAWEAR